MGGQRRRPLGGQYENLRGAERTSTGEVRRGQDYLIIYLIRVMTIIYILKVFENQTQSLFVFLLEIGRDRLHKFVCLHFVVNFQRNKVPRRSQLEFCDSVSFVLLNRDF